MIAETSMQAYAAIQNKLGARQEEVYNAIKLLGRASNEEVADYLGLPINRITGRCTELRNFGLIAVDGITKNKSGASAKVWVAKGLDDKKLERIAKEEPHYEAVSWLYEKDDCGA